MLLLTARSSEGVCQSIKAKSNRQTITDLRGNQKKARQGNEQKDACMGRVSDDFGRHAFHEYGDQMDL
jgi:hypothetical protein